MQYLKYYCAMVLVLLVSATGSAGHVPKAHERQETAQNVQDRLSAAARNLPDEASETRKNLPRRFSQWYNWNNWSNWGNWRNW